jgi:hypothetical protein
MARLSGFGLSYVDSSCYYQKVMKKYEYLAVYQLLYPVGAMRSHNGIDKTFFWHSKYMAQIQNKREMAISIKKMVVL